MKKLKQDSNGFTAIELLLIILVFAVIGFVSWHIAKTRSDTNSVTTSSTQTNQSASAPAATVYPAAYSYLTYRSTGTSPTFYVRNEKGVVLTKAAIPANDNYSYVYVRNEQALIIENTQQTSIYTTHTNSNYSLVNFSGTTTALSSSIGAVLTSATNNSALEGADTVIYTTCSTKSNTCDLSAINLNSGAITTYQTEAALQTETGLQSPFDILGASDNKVYYTYSSTFSGPFALKTYDTNTHKVINSYALQANPVYPPELSNDYKYAVYSDQSNANYIINVSNGDLVKSFSSDSLGGISPSYQNEFLWSADDENIEFTSPGVAPSSATPKMAINLFNMHTGETSTLQTYGDPRYISATALMWLSPTELYYNLDSTTDANDFGPPYDSGPSYSGLDISSDTTAANPVQSGYSFIPNEPDL